MFEVKFCLKFKRQLKQIQFVTWIKLATGLSDGRTGVQHISETEERRARGKESCAARCDRPVYVHSVLHSLVK